MLKEEKQMYQIKDLYYEQFRGLKKSESMLFVKKTNILCGFLVPISIQYVNTICTIIYMWNVKTKPYKTSYKSSGPLWLQMI